MGLLYKIKMWIVAIWKSLTEIPEKAGDVIEHAQKSLDAKMFSMNTMRFMRNDSAVATMHVADQIVELGVGAILVGGFELYGIQMIINATGLTGVVQTMFTTVLVILILVADI